MDVSDVEAVQILAALAASSAKSLQHLELQDFLAIRQDVLSKYAYYDVMSSWRALQCLSINYSALNADHLLAIARNNRSHFRTCHLRCRKTDNHGHIIPSFIWQQAVHLAPHLEVSWSIERIPTFKEVEPLLPHSLPLHSLQFWTGYNEKDDNWELACFLQYLAEHFSSCLENLTLEIEENVESIDEGLLQVVGACHYLQYLKVTATLGVQFVDTLCDTIEKNKKGLKTLYLTLSGLRDADYETLKELEQKHQPRITSQGIGFHCSADWIH